jgi:dTDP-glucose pyrophosphorylase
MQDISKLIIQETNTIKEAIKAIDLGAYKIAFVINKDEELIGSVTDGDIRRWILKSGSLDALVDVIMNCEPKYVNENKNLEETKEVFNKFSIDVLPVINDKRRIIDIISSKILFRNIKKEYNQINLPVIIMAGGKGTRLDPFTQILPKPLIPIGNKAMIEIIMDEYAKFGMNKFYLSINHKGKMIKAYFEDHESDYSFDYITEDKPLGTAGALKFLEGKIDSPFFVSNCDIIIKDDYSKIYEYHQDGEYALTMVASMQHHTVPYGVCELDEDGSLKQMNEKPQYDFLVNTGMYLLNPEVLKHIPENKFYHITYLIDHLRQNGFKVGVYPVSEQSYIDVGQWDEYKNAINKLR